MAAGEASHQPVMTREVLALLRPESAKSYIDATLGSGGHAEALLAASAPAGRVLGIDADAAALERSSRRLAAYGDRVVFRQGNFAAISTLAPDAGFAAVWGVVMDLGFSYDQVADPSRGFSFRRDGPLDMRYDQRSGETAAEVVRRMREGELADLLFELGGEGRSRRIARSIAARRGKSSPATTRELAELVERAVGRGTGRIHPATRTFQALRIHVNRELENLEAGLEGALRLLVAGGRMVVISFHSLEDRIVKNFFRTHARAGTLTALTPKPYRPDQDERAANPRSRSARLRAAELTA